MGNRIKILIYFTLISVTAFSQNLPSGAVWGNSKVPLRTVNNDTAGYADLTTLKSFFTNGLGSGTVTTVGGVNANGFTVGVTAPTTAPQITVGTSITSNVLKGNGTAILAAVAGTDYSAGTAALGTGILKSTTSTGALTIAVAGDFPTLNQSTTGNAATVTTNANLTGVVTSVGNATSIGTGAITNTMIASLDAATKLTGITPVANGGSGAATLTGYLKGTGTTAFTALSTIPTSDLSGTISNGQLANSSITTSLTATGTDVSITGSPTSLGGTLTVNVPDASATARGVITTGTQTIAGAKTLTGAATASGGFTSSAITTLSGGLINGVTTVSSTTTLTTAANVVYADATTAAFTITLPNSPANGTRIRVVKTNSTSNYVTLSRGGTNTINGNTTFVMVSNRMPIFLDFNGTDWVTE